MRKIYTFVLILTCFFVSTSNILAQESNKFITIVNPVRISSYNKNPQESINAQYSVIKKHDLSSTWLLTFDALNNKGIIDEVRKMDRDQEFGVFLEITKNSAREAGIEYNESGSWHHANSVFLSGYTQDERKMLIDKVFEKYKSIFGEYPKSIGSWWTDGFSLSYMKENYGVVANLVCADQFSTDNYQIWGQPWQIPYYPSKLHPAVPASTAENKLDLVNIQWASRDPLNGYESSLYSTQDYMVVPDKLDTEYFRNLLEVYLDNQNSDFNQITVGLESDLDASGYSGEFQKQIDVVNGYHNQGVKVVTMSDFYEKYRQKYPDFSPEVMVESNMSTWYTGPNYRLFYKKSGDKLEIIDIRVYDENLVDPYYVSPNYSLNLSINIQPLIDSIQNPESTWELSKDTQIIPSDESILIKGKNIKVPKNIDNNPLVNIKKRSDQVEIDFNKVVINSKEGDIIKGFTSEAIHFFRTKKAIFKLLTGKGLEYFKKIDYLIPQGEIYALLYLKSLPGGKVMVFDNECLQCSWHTKNKPIVFANLRSYVKKYSGHPIIKNSSVFNADTRIDAKRYLKKTKAKYIYLVKFEEYYEKLPFSPGDLEVEKIYANANAEIWKVK